MSISFKTIRIGLMMTIALCAFGGAAFAANTSAEVASGTSSGTEGLSITKLPNGLTVLIKEDKRFPLVSLRLYVHAGSGYETDEDAGISHILEHMVFKGTEKRDRVGIAADVEATGGYLNAATSFDYTMYLTDMTGEHWNTGLDVLKDMAMHPTLDPKELEAEKNVIVSELKRNEDNPSSRVFMMYQKAAFEGTAYRNPIIGFEETIRGMTSERIRAYIDRYYQPQSMLLTICGNVDTEEALKEAVAQFGNLKNTHPVELVEPVHLESKGFTVVQDSGPWKKVTLAVGLPAAPMLDASSAQLDVLADILGGDSASRLYRTYYYDKQLVDSIGVYNYGMERAGMFYIYATLDADKLLPFWETLVRDLAGLSHTTFSDEELNRAKLNLETAHFRSQETVAGLASSLSRFQFFDNGLQGEANYLRLVRDTDQKVLQGLIRENFRPENLCLSILLPNDAKLPAEAEDFPAWAKKTLEAQWQPEKNAAQDSAKTGAAQPEIVDLGAGRKVILLHDDTLPFTSANLLFYGGDSLLAEKDQGLAAFTASLLTSGTKSLSATAMEEFQSDRASSLSAWSGKQSFGLSVYGPSRFTGDMFGLMHDVIAQPAMKEEEAARARKDQIAEITTAEEKAFGLVRRRMYPFLFGSHPYGYLSQGEAARVAEFTAKDGIDFWKDQSAYPWVLSVCGDFDRDAVLSAAAKLPVPGKRSQEILPPQWNAVHDLDLELKERNQAHLFMAFPTVGMGHEDEAGLDLLQSVLDGQSGLLFRDLRDVHGLGYTVTAFNWKSQKAGMLVFYIGTEPEKMEEAEMGFRRIIGDLHDKPVDDGDISRGKSQLNGDYYRSLQTVLARSSEAATLSLLGQPLDASRKLVDNAQHISATELQSLAEKYLQLEKAYIIKVLP